MSERNHSGENTAGVTVQIRSVPLKVEDEEETKTTKISVRIDDAQKCTPDIILGCWSSRLFLS